MIAMALLYKRDFLIYQEIGKSPFRATSNDFENLIMLCYSHGNHYDIVYPKSYLTAAAICQSLVYEILYKKVFRLGDEVDLAVKTMLHDKTYSKQRRNLGLLHTFRQQASISEVRDDANGLPEDEQDASGEIRKALAQGIPPFPYKVAKALDPSIYRNVEFDLWNEANRDHIRYDQLVIPEFAPGVKCLVRLDKDQREPFNAHIQDMSPEHGPVTVFIIELGEKCIVPYDSLQPLPIPAYKLLSWHGSKSYRMWGDYLRTFPVKVKGKRKVSRKEHLQDSSSTASTETVPVITQVQSSPVSNLDKVSCQLLPVNGSYLQPCYQNKSRVAELKKSNHRKEDSQLHYTAHPQINVPLTTHSDVNNRQQVTSPFWNTTNIQVPFSFTQMQTSALQSGQLPLLHSTSVSDTKLSDSDTECDLCPTSAPQANHCCQIVPSMLTHYFPCQTNVTYTNPSYLNVSECSNDDSSLNSSQSPLTQPYSLPLSEEAVITVPQPVLHSTLPVPSQPMTVFPLSSYSNMLIPYGDSGPLAFNMQPWRSRDPAGSDLPLNDLATVRFFYNLGCDYYRMLSVPVPSLPLWSCNGGLNMTYNSAGQGTSPDATEFTHQDITRNSNNNGYPSVGPQSQSISQSSVIVTSPSGIGFPTIMPSNNIQQLNTQHMLASQLPSNMTPFMPGPLYTVQSAPNE